jgi:biotin carboxyl carrier protein
MARTELNSPLPGVFYRRPSPDSDVFKNDGDMVVATDILGVIEVMKSFHEIPAGASGSNLKFLVDDGDAVMAGQAIAEIDA